MCSFTGGRASYVLLLEQVANSNKNMLHYRIVRLSINNIPALAINQSASSGMVLANLASIFLPRARMRSRGKAMPPCTCLCACVSAKKILKNA